MIKKQIITMAVCGALAIVLAVAYFAVFAPMLEPEEEEIIPIELIDELEVRSSDQTSVYMFPPVERARMKKIEVYNEHGGYTFYKESGTFVIKDKELAPYDLTAFSYLVTSTGSSVALKRYLIDENTDLSDFGLSAEDDPAYFIITTEEGDTHKVWVGDQVPTGGGYYCQYDGRKAIYVIGASLGLTVFSDVHELITPTLGLNVAQNAIMDVSLFGIIKNGAPIVEIKTLSPEDNGTDKTEEPMYSYEFALRGLEELVPNSTTYSQCVQLFSGLAGTKTVAIGNEVTDEVLKSKYGIDTANPNYCVYYRYDGESAYIYISKPNEEGICYAYSAVYNIVVTINISTVTAYNYSISDFVESNIVKDAITTVTDIGIKGSLNDEGIAVDSRYGLKAVYDEENGKTVQSIWDTATNKKFDDDEVRNFRQIYKDIIRLYIEGEVDIKNISNAKHIGTLSLTVDGETKTYDFYAYNSTRCYFTINGVQSENFAFYVNRDNVETLIRDTYLFNNGYTIDPGI